MKKSIPVIITLFIIYSTGPALSQSVSIGVRGGISIPNLSTNSNNPVSQGYSSILGADAAIFVNIRFSDLFSLQPMLEFSQQGGKRKGRQPLPARGKIKRMLGGQKYMYVDIDRKAQLNYLMLPVLAKFGWNLGPESENHFRIYVDAGPFVAYLLSAHTKFSNTKTKIYSSMDDSSPLLVRGHPLVIDIAKDRGTKVDIRSSTNHWNVGISGNIGIAYHFERSSIFIEAGGNYGFIKIQDNPNNGQNRTGAATISLGYTYEL